MNRGIIETQERSLEKIYNIPLTDIAISTDNVRVTDVTKDLEELVASIKRHGLLQPIVLMGQHGDTPYKLISGQRRFLAHQKLGKGDIRAVFAGTLSETEAVVKSLVENMQRRDLDYHDTAKAITYLYKEYNKDERLVQKETGLSIRKIRDLILIEERATPKMKTLMEKDKVSPADVKRAIRAAQGNLSKAETLVDLIIKRKPTTHQKRRLATYGEREKRATAEKILEKAMQPHVEQSILISLPDEVRQGLITATEAMSIEAEELAAKVLADWLRNQGFLA